MDYLFNDKDVEIFITKGTGAGGQKRNKTETAITIKHIPTGLIVRNDETRSKNRNIELAKQQLNKKLIYIITKEKHDSLNNERKEAIFTKRIRTYNYKRGEVVNHLNGKKADLQKVLNGNLDLIR